VADEPDLEEEGHFSLGPTCRSCGVAMEPGYLVVQSRGEYTLSRNFTWHEPGEVGDTPGPNVADLWASTHGAGPWLKGYRCRDCEILEVRYGKGGLGPTGWKISSAAAR
jgi:hypothetical protein